MNKTIKLKTNLKCNHCVAKVKPVLDGAKGVQNWSVDLTNPERILTVEIDENGSAEEIVRLLSEVGYRAEIQTE